MGIKKISLASLGYKKCGCWIESGVPVCNPFTEESGKVTPLCETSLTERSKRAGSVSSNFRNLEAHSLSRGLPSSTPYLEWENQMIQLEGFRFVILPLKKAGGVSFLQL